MALERLQSVFNNISENDALLNDSIPSPSIEEIGDDHSYGTNGFFDSINNVLQPDGTYRRLPVINIGTSADSSPLSRELIRSEDERNLTADGLPQIRLGRYATHYSGLENQNGVTLLDSDGTYRQYPGLAERSEDSPNIRLKHIDGRNIGKNNTLGRPGSGLELTDIFDSTHGNNYDNKRKLFGQGSVTNLDIRASGDQFGFNEPFIVKPIADEGKNSIKGGYSSDFLPYNATADDLLRFGKFYTTSKGLEQIARENLVNVLIGDGSFKLGGFNLPNPLRGLMAPPIPFPNTGLLSILHSSVQGASLIPGGGSARKPFRIQYSERHSLGLPFKDQGDRPIGIGVLKKIKLPSPEGKTGAKARLARIARSILEPIKDKGMREARKLARAPKIKKTPFIDLSHGSTNTFYDDVFSRSGTVYRNAEDEQGRYSSEVELEKEINRGDFYVKIKDLRDNTTSVYFRGFVTGITENITPTWNPVQYIGRSEDVWNYQKAERDLSFNLKVYPFGVSEFNFMWDKIEFLTSLAYPSYLEEDTAKNSSRMVPPFTELYMGHIGTRQKGQFGYIKSLTYTVPESGDWDAETALPRFFEIAISYQILSRIPPAKRDQTVREYEFYGANKTIAESDKPDVLTTDPPIVDDIGLESQIA